MNVDFEQNKLSAIGVVCGIVGLATVYLAVLAIGLGFLARTRREKVWWWAVVAGVIGFFGGPQLSRMVGGF